MEDVRSMVAQWKAQGFIPRTCCSYQEVSLAASKKAIIGPTLIPALDGRKRKAVESLNDEPCAFRWGGLQCMFCKGIGKYVDMVPASMALRYEQMIEVVCERFGGIGIVCMCRGCLPVWVRAEDAAQNAHHLPEA